MASLVHFELMVPERVLMAEEVDSVVVPGIDGDFGVFPGHAGLISALAPGSIVIFRNGAVAERIFVEGGIAEVTSEGCIVLADRAVKVTDIDKGQADSAIDAARALLADARDEEELAVAQKALSAAEAKRATLEPSPYS